MQILGVASSLPETILSDQLLTAQPLSATCRSNDSLSIRAGIASRRISLPLELLNSDAVATPLGAWSAATTTPTALGVQAVRSLLAKTGVALEEISLVLADCGTPYQTCPSEAQRIMGELGIKTAAFDLIGGISSIPLMLSVASRWSPARFAPRNTDDTIDGETSPPRSNYILLVSVNTPSQQINYQLGGELEWLCGDGAAAVLITPNPVHNARRSYTVTHHSLRFEGLSRAQPIVVEEFLRINPKSVLSPTEVRDFISSELEALSAINPSLSSKAVFIAPQLYAEEARDFLATKIRIPPQMVVSGVSDCGFSLGSSYGIALERSLEVCSAGDLKDSPIIILHCGDGRRGSLVLSPQHDPQ
jgi:3-oxoacyl-[acyl-carrier-protein] synthase III